MSGPRSVTANFSQNQYSLSVGVNPSGSGTVTRNPDKLAYVYGEQVALTATANAGYTFSGWSGDASGSAIPLTITMNSNKTVTASFNTVIPPPLGQGQWKIRFLTENGDSITTAGKVISYYFVNGDDATITIIVEDPLNFVPTYPDIGISDVFGGNCTLRGDGSVMAQAGQTFSFAVKSLTPGAVLSARDLPLSSSGLRAAFDPGTGLFHWSTSPNDLGKYTALFQAEVMSPSPMISEFVVSIDIGQ